MTQLAKQIEVQTVSKGLKAVLPVSDFRAMTVPGVTGGASMGIAYIRVTDLPGTLDRYMEINPRIPSRTRRGSLSGPIIKAILETLRNEPEEMSLKNQGIYLLVEQSHFIKHGSGRSYLELRLTDPKRHGIINGGHTYAAIMEAIETANPEQLEQLKKAYVRLHVFQGIPKNFVPDIAEGLNRSKQVDDLSLANLQGELDLIRAVMKGKPAEREISYYQGAVGNVYASELLVYLEMFNQDRFDEVKHPNVLYNKQSLGLKYFAEDMKDSKHYMKMLIDKLPEVLWLADNIRKLTPEAAKRNKFKFGLAKVDSEGRAGTAGRSVKLYFTGEVMNYKVPNGWVFPMLAAFRANLKVSQDGKSLEWKVPLTKLLPEVIDSLVAVCVSEHKENALRPELTGKKESAYSRCYTRVQLCLAKRGES
jgi:hypothetical protein